MKFGPETNIFGLPATSFSADLGNAPVPDRKYFAETCSVVLFHHSMRVMFGQSEFGSKRLRNLLIVTMTMQGTHALLSSVEEMQMPSLKEITEIIGFSPEISEPVTEEPSQAVVPLAANFALCGISGFESCLDFYEASPFALQVAIRSKTLYVDATVRVNLRTPLLLGMLVEMRRLLPGLQFPRQESP